LLAEIAARLRGRNTRLRAGRPPGIRRPRAIAIALLILAALPGCPAVRAPTNPELATTAQTGDILALSDALELLIAEGKDTPTDREYAYQVAKKVDANTAASAYARAAITGRLVQDQGLRAADLVPAVEKYGLRSRKLDPDFRGGAATVLIGKLYVMAPATLLKKGDSETGLEMLEEVTTKYPEVPENHLRLAEAYVALHDPEPAAPHLCFCLQYKDALRPDDQRVLKGLLDDAGPLKCAPPPGAP
jgi:hypothetical protein